MTLIIAHRGASHAEAENTVAAFRRAVEFGAEGIELDVRRTADDRLVIHHDARLADGRAIIETHAADLPDRVPTLEAALDACEGAFVNIEIKNDPDEPDADPTDWVLHRTAVELARRNSDARWLISAFRWETVDRCRRMFATLDTAWLVVDVDAAAVARCAAAGHAAIHPWVGALDADTVAAAHAVGLAVNTWTCDDPVRMRELVAWGVDGICTNVPDIGVDVRRSIVAAS